MKKSNLKRKIKRREKKVGTEAYNDPSLYKVPTRELNSRVCTGVHVGRNRISCIYGKRRGGGNARRVLTYHVSAMRWSRLDILLEYNESKRWNTGSGGWYVWFAQEKMILRQVCFNIRAKDSRRSSKSLLGTGENPGICMADTCFRPSLEHVSIAW